MIVYYPNKILKYISRKTGKGKGMGWDNLINVMKNILGSHRDYIGIAAVQIGLLRRIAIIKYIESYITVSNPIILWCGNQITIKREWCISIPSVSRLVSRYTHILISYRNNRNIRVRKAIQRNNSICIQHEIDHLNGKLINDM